MFGIEQNKGINEWLPEIMQLNGNSETEKYLINRIDIINKNVEDIVTRGRLSREDGDKLKQNQEKINDLWNNCANVKREYGISIDPRFLLSIIFQEGTGSFNTSSTNRAADGGHGVETNSAIDFMKANNLILGKILGYAYYGDEFSEAVRNNSSYNGIDDGGGDLFQYVIGTHQLFT